MEFVGITILDTNFQEKKLYQFYTQQPLFYSPAHFCWKEHNQVRHA